MNSWSTLTVIKAVHQKQWTLTRQSSIIKHTENLVIEAQWQWLSQIFEMVETEEDYWKEKYVEKHLFFLPKNILNKCFWTWNLGWMMGFFNALQSFFTISHIQWTDFNIFNVLNMSTLHLYYLGLSTYWTKTWYWQINNIKLLRSRSGAKKLNWDFLKFKEL